MMPTKEEIELATSVARRAVSCVLGSRRDMTEDIIQQAWLKTVEASSRASGFRGDSKFSTWFTRVAINCALMDNRPLRNKCTVSLQELECNKYEDGKTFEWQIPSGDLSPLDAAIARERNALLRAAVLTLTPKLRSAILEYAVSARGEMGKSQAMKFRRYRGVRKLRSALAGVLS